MKLIMPRDMVKIRDELAPIVKRQGIVVAPGNQVPGDWEDWLGLVETSLRACLAAKARVAKEKEMEQRGLMDREERSQRLRAITEPTVGLSLAKTREERLRLRLDAMERAIARDTGIQRQIGQDLARELLERNGMAKPEDVELSMEDAKVAKLPKHTRELLERNGLRQKRT